MAHRNVLEKRTDADMAALYWWRRDAVAEEPEEPAPLTQRLAALAERAAPNTPRIVDLRGNHLRANAEARRAGEAQTVKDAVALDPDLLAAIHDERRKALAALVIGLIATAAPAAAAIHAATMREPVAFCFAIAGGCAACFAVCHAAHWFLLARADEPPKSLE